MTAGASGPFFGVHLAGVIDCKPSQFGQNIARQWPLRQSLQRTNQIINLIGADKRRAYRRTGQSKTDRQTRQIKAEPVGNFSRLFGVYLRSEEHTSELQSQSKLLCR